jgi:hypothetical protein
LERSWDLLGAEGPQGIGEEVRSVIGSDDHRAIHFVPPDATLYFVPPDATLYGG